MKGYYLEIPAEAYYKAADAFDKRRRDDEALGTKSSVIERVMSFVVGITFDWDCMVVTIHVGPCNCTNFRTAIQEAERLMPEVRMVRVVDGRQVVSAYEIGAEGKWFSHGLKRNMSSSHIS